MYSNYGFSCGSMTGLFSLAGPEPATRLEKIEETTNKISLALEIQEGLRTKPGRCFLLSNRSQLLWCSDYFLVRVIN